MAIPPMALLNGRTHAYGYRYTEAFLSQVACADGAECFTNTLSSWATHLWHPVETAAAEHPHHPQALTCYLDGYRKPVYSDVLPPRGLVGRLGKAQASQRRERLRTTHNAQS